jgi:hypothetical protein
MNLSIYNLSDTELKDGLSSAPGRVRNFLINPKERTLPPSCTLYIYNNSLKEAIRFIAVALKRGSGVKLVFPDTFDLLANIDINNQPEIRYTCCIDHPEVKNLTLNSSSFNNFSSEEKAFFRNIEGTMYNFKSSDSTFYIEDSLEDFNGILDALSFICECFEENKDRVFDFSKIRNKGTKNSNGLIASGVISFYYIFHIIEIYYTNPNLKNFIQVFGIINDVLRRGGYKKGIITSSMSENCRYFEEYLNLDISDIYGSHKKAAIISKEILKPVKAQTLKALIDSINRESTFLEKFLPAGYHYNVCEGLILQNYNTCLIWRQNLANCTIEEIVSGGLETATRLCELHYTWRERTKDIPNCYSPIEKDLQIGLDIMGLANLLGTYSVTYKEFNDALEDILDAEILIPLVNESLWADAYKIAGALCEMYRATTLLCDAISDSYGQPKLKYIHTVEPSQSHSYTVLSKEGFTTCRGIWPPINQIVNRYSNIEQNITIFHGDVENIQDVGKEEYWRTNVLYFKMMQKFGRPHSISMDWYEQASEFEITKFLESSLPTKYYTEAEKFDSRFLNKIATIATTNSIPSCGLRPGECEDCS